MSTGTDMSEQSDGLIPVMIRVSPSVKERFTQKAATLGRKTGSLGRELIEAFVDGRCTITPPKDPLYEEPNVRN